MTLILTAITNYGIVQASDSSLTYGNGAAAGTSPKVFRLDFAPGAVAVAGAFTVGSEDMDTWMPTTIAAYAMVDSPTLRGFAEHLRRSLEAQMAAGEPSLIHIAGYADDGASNHPEMHFVRNVAEIERTKGEYRGFERAFQASEDFWARDYLRPEVRDAYKRGEYWLYLNGYPAGRIGYLGLDRSLNSFFDTAWNHPDWLFRRPQSLDEIGKLIALKLRVITTMFEISDYPAPYIGGAPQVLTVPAPAGSITL